MAFTVNFQRVIQYPSRESRYCVFGGFYSSTWATWAGDVGHRNPTSVRHILVGLKEPFGESTRERNQHLDPRSGSFAVHATVKHGTRFDPAPSSLASVLSPIFILRDQPIGKAKFTGWVTSSSAAIPLSLIGTDASGHIVDYGPWIESWMDSSVAFTLAAGTHQAYRTSATTENGLCS